VTGGAAESGATASMDIRRIVEADLPMLEREVLRAGAAGEFLGSSDPDASFFLKMFQFAPHPVAGAFTAGGALLGFISPEVKIVVVNPGERRRGIGRALVEAGVEIERERGRPNLLLGVVPSDAVGHDFLESTGFAFHSTLWDLGLPDDASVAAPAWPPGYVARPFERADARAWIDLFNLAFADHATPLQMNPDVAEGAPVDPDFEDADTHLVVDARTAELVGFCATNPRRTGGSVAPEAEIWTIGVRPDRQGQGLGRQLLRWGVERLRSIGARHIELSVNARNERALGLYEREGFVRSRTRERWAKPVEPLA
jgi:mycothiol synthase